MAGAGGRLMGLFPLDEVKVEGYKSFLKLGLLFCFPFFPSTEYET